MATAVATTKAAATGRRLCARPGAGYGGYAMAQAAYGAGNRVIDVTDRLRAQVTGNQLSVRASNNLAGYDPAPDTPQGAVGHILHRWPRIPVTLRESEYLRLP